MARTYFCFLILLVVLLSNCKSRKPSEFKSPVIKHAEFIPVTQFFLGELFLIDSLPVTPLRLIVENGKTDSQWLKKSEIKNLASEFLTPVIDSQHLYPYFKESSFLDQTINFYTFTYEAKNKLPEDMTLTRWDVYVDPKNKNISRVYLVKNLHTTNGKSITEQLTWKAGTSFKINYISELQNGKVNVKEEEIIWNFNSNSHN